MYKRILVPFDGSPTAKLGLAEAIKLAKEQGATLRIVHIVNEWLAVSPDASGADLGPVIEGLRAAGEAILDEAQEAARAAHVDAQTVLVEEMGDPAGVQIVRQASEWPADLVVCGTHGRRGVRRLLLGSDAEYVVRHSPVPVLSVRGEAQTEEQTVRVASA